jgi:L-arabinonolactonase
MKLVKQLSVANQLGENILWDVRLECLWWTDILSKKLYRYHISQEFLEHWSLDERLCSFALSQLDNVLLCAFDGGFAEFNALTGNVRWIDRCISDNSGQRMNDGRVDRQGRYWVGAMVENAELSGASQNANLYRLDGNEAVVQMQGIGISNSLCWSPDGQTMYFADSTEGRIDQFEFNTRSGDASHRRTFVTIPGGIAAPDGSCIDADGNLWNAQWQGSCVQQYSPAGIPLKKVEVPASQVTCCCFAGKDLSLLCVTTARVDLSEEQLRSQADAGAVFIYQTEARGLAESRVTLPIR